MSIASAICNKHPRYWSHRQDCEQEAALARLQGRCERWAVIDYLRKVRAIRRTAAQEVPLLESDASYHPEMGMLRSIDAGRIDLSLLTEQQKEVINAKYYEGIRQVDLAASMGVTQGRVSQIHSQALRVLRSAFMALITVAGVCHAEDFSIAIFSDRQLVAGTNCGGSANCTLWDQSIDYLVNPTNIATHNLKGVFSVGDNVNSYTTAEWNGFLNGSGGKGWNAIRATDLIWGSACGNHDWDASFRPRTCSGFNDVDKFHPDAFAGKTWYKGSKNAGNNANYYLHWENADGIKYGVIFIEFFPDAPAMEWAKGIADANPDRNYFLITHAYTQADNSAPYENAQRITSNGTFGPNSYRIATPGQTVTFNSIEFTYETCGVSDTVYYQTNNCTRGSNGTELWNTLIKPTCNIIATFGGHFGGSSGYNLEANDCGRRVYQVTTQEASATVPYFVLVTLEPDTTTFRVRHWDASTGAVRTGSTFVAKAWTDWEPIRARRRKSAGGLIPPGRK